MKTVNLLLALLIVGGLTGVGCTSITSPATTATATTDSSELDGTYVVITADSDFTPPTGRPLDPPPASAGERRLLLATSNDGITFTATGTILTDQGNVPDMVITPDGTIYVYYIGQSIDPTKEESTVVAVSSDQGVTWTFRTLDFIDLPQPRDPSDPDVVLLDDGTFRMYYTSSLSNGRLGIVYADSADGFTFTYQGEALSGAGDYIDSTTFFYDDLWHMYVLQEKERGQLYATSADGLTFSIVSTQPIRLPLDGYVISNPVIQDGALRMFGFNLMAKNIRSFNSNDGAAWEVGDIALTGEDAVNLGSDYIQDSTVGQLSDGSYLMVYVSELP